MERKRHGKSTPAGKVPDDPDRDPVSALAPFDRRCYLALLDPAPRETLAEVATRLLARWSAPGAGDPTGRGGGRVPPGYRLARMLGRPNLARAIRATGPLVCHTAPLLGEALAGLLRAELAELAASHSVGLPLRLAAVRDLLAILPLSARTGSATRARATARTDRMRAALDGTGEPRPAHPDGAVLAALDRQVADQERGRRATERERSTRRRSPGNGASPRNPGPGKVP